MIQVAIAIYFPKMNLFLVEHYVMLIIVIQTNIAIEMKL